MSSTIKTFILQIETLHHPVGTNPNKQTAVFSILQKKLKTNGAGYFPRHRQAIYSTPRGHRRLYTQHTITAHIQSQVHGPRVRNEDRSTSAALAFDREKELLTLRQLLRLTAPPPAAAQLHFCALARTGSFNGAPPFSSPLLLWLPASCTPAPRGSRKDAAHTLWLSRSGCGNLQMLLCTVTLAPVLSFYTVFRAAHARVYSRDLRLFCQGHRSMGLCSSEER